MARTQAADFDQRRIAILDRAAGLYGEFGFHGTSIADLAEACGISKSLLYHYFISKEEILFEIMASHMEALVEISRRIPEDLRPQPRLVELTRGLMALYRDAASRHKVLVNDLDKLAPRRRREIVEKQRLLINLVDGLLAALSPALAQDSRRRRAATMLYFGMINWTHTWFNPDGPLPSDALAEMAAMIFLKGLPQR